MERISNDLRSQLLDNGRKPMCGRQNVKADQSFGELLKRSAEAQELSQSGVEFSKHAKTRAEERGIQITPQLMDQLKAGMERAQEKGATNIIAMDAESAFIINVPRARVITAITQDEMKKNIFTNIDGAVFL